MGLDLYPKPCPCQQHGPTAPGLPKFGATHSISEGCPFQADDFPKGMYGTCCSIRGKVAAEDLIALGEGYLARRMFRDMNAEKAVEFAGALEATANLLEEKYANVTPKPEGGSYWQELDLATNQWSDGPRGELRRGRRAHPRSREVVSEGGGARLRSARMGVTTRREAP